MNLHIVASCPGCGSSTRDSAVTVYAWLSTCTRTNADSFLNTTTHDSVLWPHLHVTCNRCRFTWLSPVSDQKKLIEVL